MSRKYPGITLGLKPEIQLELRRRKACMGTSIASQIEVALLKEWHASWIPGTRPILLIPSQPKGGIEHGTKRTADNNIVGRQRAACRKPNN